MGMIEDRMAPDFEKGKKKVWRTSPFSCVIKIGPNWYKGVKVGPKYVVDYPIKESMAEKMIDHAFMVRDADADELQGKPRLLTDEERAAKHALIGIENF